MAKSGTLHCPLCAIKKSCRLSEFLYVPRQEMVEKIQATPIQLDQTRPVLQMRKSKTEDGTDLSDEFVSDESDNTEDEPASNESTRSDIPHLASEALFLFGRKS